MVKVLQIVPRLPPSISGVGDYALMIAKFMREQHNIMTVFAVADSGGVAIHEIDGFAIHKLTPDTRSILSASSGIRHQLLHYVGYGYEKRGCPIWLLSGLRKLRSSGNSSNLVTMFHELYASGKPWQSSFWTHPVQKSICRGVAQVSDVIVSNRLRSAEILKKMSGGREAVHLPVFSTVGEPEALASATDRQRRLVLFGGTELRRKTLVDYLGSLQAACKRWGITEVIEIGPGTTPDCKIGIPWRKLGVQTATEVSDWLDRSLLGFLSYPSSYLEKSTIFAAYAAHGVVPLLPDACMEEDTLGLRSALHYLSSAHSDGGDALLHMVGSAVFDWYQDHRSHRQSEVFAKLISM
jgi:hypothetical protein